MVDENHDFKPNLLSYLSERSMLLDYTLPITNRIQVNDVTFDGLNLSDLSPKFLKIIQEHDSFPLIQVQEKKRFYQSILE